MTMTCEHCGADYPIEASDAGDPNRFCSVECEDCYDDDWI